MARIVMRACRNPSCAKGEFPSSTARAAYCSSACRLIHHRQKKKEQQSQTQTQEETSMATQTPMQFVFSETEYRTRCQNAKGFYESRIEKPSAGIVGAIVEFTPGTLVEALEVYHQHRAAGWTTLDSMAGLPTATLVESPRASFITLYLKKPEREQERDLAKLCKQVRADYEAELEAALNVEIDRQVAISLAKDERDRQQAEQEQRLKREQEVRDELAASRAKLRDQLIESGKLNTDGSAA